MLHQSKAQPLCTPRAKSCLKEILTNANEFLKNQYCMSTTVVVASRLQQKSMTSGHNRQKGPKPASQLLSLSHIMD